MNISLFLGAGASVPYGFPTTAEFKEKLKQIPDKPNPNTLDALLENPDYQDVEHILKAIEEIQEFAKTRGAKFFSHSILFSYRNQSGQQNFDKILEQINENYLKIKEYVYKFYSWNDMDVKILERNLSHVFSILSKSQDGIHIFTTNYDQSIETYVDDNPEFTRNDGFVHNSKNQKSIFDETSFSNSKNIVNLYKLHGSLNWKITKFGITRLDSESQNKNESNNLVVYPTLSPKDGVLKKPFNILRDLFENHISQTDVIIVIGYSFRDEHVNDIFKNFLKKTDKRMIIISPSARDNWKTNFLTDGEKYRITELGFNPKNSPSNPKIQQFPNYYEQYLEIKTKQESGSTEKDWIEAKKQLDGLVKEIIPDPSSQIILINSTIEIVNSYSLLGLVPMVFDPIIHTDTNP